ncbi:uncharacterized protein LOC118184260 isoform X2 [Stegodyphus dumicola]|uniref:uncharacterized protein LOC118184260 isoform X2 n=1 Tax=Stegodyphus dumicola TaxID=202533 RepID=UPI0015AF49C6|nr:uncharacterized protein LOC118184260 isoform X2 [Stegodyphus dumicola]
MDLKESKSFFKNLKECVKEINKGVEEANKTLLEVPDENVAAAKIADMRDKIHQLKGEADKLKKDIKQKNSVSKSFFLDFEELILEAEHGVTDQENYLKEYGYEPLVLSKEPEQPIYDTTPVTKVKCSKIQVSQLTPMFPDFGTHSPKSQNVITSSRLDSKKSSSPEMPVPVANIKMIFEDIQTHQENIKKNDSNMKAFGDNCKNNLPDPPTPTLPTSADILDLDHIARKLKFY